MRSRLRSLLAVIGIGAMLALPTAVAAKPGHHGRHHPHPPSGPFQHVPQATAMGTGGAAASVDSVATGAAIDALRHGGNAVDAAVSAAAVLGVTEPFSSGVGGGGFMLIRTPDGRITTIDGRETAPAKMKPDSFIENGTPLAFADARWSGLSAGVPGTVATWDLALRKYGTWRLGRALEAGIDVARRGFVVDQTFFDQTRGATNIIPTGETADYFDDIPSTAALYLDADRTPHDVGTVQRNPDLAKTYELLARFGAGAFYHGPIAKAMAQAAQNPPKGQGANHAWRPGLMTEDDIARYRAIERDPTHVNYRGLDVWGMGPPSSGGSTVGEVLNILNGYDRLGADRSRAYHLYLEAARLAYADRGKYLADPDFIDVPLRGLLSKSFADERRALITDQAKNAVVPPGDPTDNQDGGPAPHVSATQERLDGRSTTHLTVTDRNGAIVTYTFTIESTGGNGVVVPGYGFLLNNELTDFTYSDVNAANRPDSGKRPRSSMAPTIITAGRRPVLALGSPGGSTIITTVLQILLERIDLGTPLPQAIETARVSQRNEATSEAEPAFLTSPLATALGAAPYMQAFRATAPSAVPPNEIGAATGIEFDRHGFLAAAEPKRRGGGAAAVVRPSR